MNRRIVKQAGYSWIVVILLILLVLVGGIFAYEKFKPQPEVVNIVPTEKLWEKKAVIGTSVEGRPIESYTYGDGEKHLLFVGGIHGGYEWNSVLLAYEIMDYLKVGSSTIPANMSITIVPNANPDGLAKVVSKEGKFTPADVTPVAKATLGLGRFNANDVDLNRNFDCKWQATSTWRSTPVSAGTSAFSEPEARAIRDLVADIKPLSVVFWHSQANAVYASECENGILPVTRDIMRAYSNASGYKAVDTFDAYPVTGDAEGWLASINIPAITVELSTHNVTEYDKNLEGVKAILNYFSN